MPPDPDAPTRPLFNVVCEDGVIRHPAPFLLRSDAAEFADQGHCCTNRHDIVEVPSTIGSAS